MSKSTPSLLALLGLVAVAGYQNRSKISEMLSDARGQSAGAAQFGNPDSGGLMSDISRMFQSGTGGNALSKGLTDLLAQFKSAGNPVPAESWIGDGPNTPLDVEELERILGQETLDDLGTKTGMTRSQLLLRLKAALPEVVNRLTPAGRIPTETEAQTLA